MQLFEVTLYLTSLGGAAESWWKHLLGFLVFHNFLVVLGVIITAHVSPISAGSGIPETKAILAGFEVPEFLTLRTLFAKSTGVILMIGSGMPVGKEGPFIHAAAIVGHQAMALSRHVFPQEHNSPRAGGGSLRGDRHDERRHATLSAAAAVGVSSAFGAPIGGVLFCVEAASQIYFVAHYWGAFVAAAAGAFVARILHENEYTVFTPSFEKSPYERWELVAFALLSVLCGLLGGVYVRVFSRIHSSKVWAKVRAMAADEGDREAVGGLVNGLKNCLARFINNKYSWSIFVATLCALTTFGIGDYMRLGMREALDDLFSDDELSEGDSRHGIKWGNDHESVLTNICWFTLVTTCTSVLAIGLPVSNGLVTPCFVIGACLGRLVGETMEYISYDVVPGGYAIVGAAAFATAVTGKLSIGIVVSELTSQLSYSIPVLGAVLIGKAFGEMVSIPIYDQMAKDKHLPHWPEVPPGMLSSSTASYVEHVATLDGSMTMAAVRKMLNENMDTEFPVVSSSNAETSAFIGSTTRVGIETIVEVSEAQGDQQTPLSKYLHNGQLPISYSAPRIPVLSTLNQVRTRFRNNGSTQLVATCRLNVHKRYSFAHLTPCCTSPCSALHHVRPLPCQTRVRHEQQRARGHCQLGGAARAPVW